MTSGNVRRRFDDNFKRQAVQKCITSGKSVTHVAASLGIDRTNLQKWKKKYGYEFESIEETAQTGATVSKDFMVLKKEFESLKETVIQLRSIVQKSLTGRYLNQ